MDLSGMGCPVRSIFARVGWRGGVCAALDCTGTATWGQLHAGVCALHFTTSLHATSPLMQGIRLCPCWSWSISLLLSFHIHRLTYVLAPPALLRPTYSTVPRLQDQVPPDHQDDQALQPQPEDHLQGQEALHRHVLNGQGRVCWWFRPVPCKHRSLSSLSFAGWS